MDKNFIPDNICINQDKTSNIFDSDSDIILAIRYWIVEFGQSILNFEP